MTWGSALGPDVGGQASVDASIGGLDTSRAHPARVYDRWLGGKDHFGVDRVVADRVAELAPWAAVGARANRRLTGARRGVPDPSTRSRNV